MKMDFSMFNLQSNILFGHFDRESKSTLWDACSFSIVSFTSTKGFRTSLKTCKSDSNARICLQMSSMHIKSSSCNIMKFRREIPQEHKCDHWCGKSITYGRVDVHN